MSGYLGTILTAVSAALEFNQATLSGAIDVIVVEDDQGKRHCSPFYVRFGKLQLLKSRGTPVDVELNDCKTDLRMYLGAAGEAYFYDPELAEKLQTTSGDVPFRKEELEEGEIDEAAGDSPTNVIPDSKERLEDGEIDEDPTDSATNAVSVPREELEEGEIDETAADSPTSAAPVLEADHVAFNDIAEEPSSSMELPPSDLIDTTPTSVDGDEPSGPPSFRPTVSLPAFAIHNDEEFYTRAIRSTSDLGFPNFGYMSDSEMELTRGERDGTTEVVDEPRSPPVSDPQRRWTTQWARGRSALQKKTVEVQLVQDDEKTSSDASHDALPDSSARKRVKDTSHPARGPLSAVTSHPSEEQLTSLYGLPGPDGSAQGTPGAASPDSSTASGNKDLPGSQESAVSDNAIPKSGDKSSGENETVVDPANVEKVTLDTAAATRSLFSNSSAVISIPVDNVQVDQEEDSKLDLRSLDGFEESPDAVREGMREKLEEALQTTASSLHQDDADSDAEGVIEMSLCGNSLTDGLPEDDVMAIFQQHRVTHAQFVADPNILYDKSLLFRIEDRLVDFRIAAPFVMAMLAYRTPMDIDMLSKMLTKPAAEKPPKPMSAPPKRFGWFGWSSSAVEGEPLLADEDLLAIAAENAAKGTSTDAIPAIPVEESIDQRSVPTIDGASLVLPSPEKPGAGGEQIAVTNVPVEAGESAPTENATDTPTPGADDFAPQVSEEEAVFAEADYESECFSFLPSSDQLENLDLKPGANEIRFVLASRTAELRCRIFLWSNDSKIVISDVDGTITRSDLLGHLLPAVGRDWSQVGVAGLYSQIAKNGYKMLYLTARPIGQASQTRDFLHNVTQGTHRLPNGPVLMSPNRLMESLTREVIRRKPHEFKIACLRDVRCLFPPTYNPFHAGFGNRDTDVISYRAVGLIPQRCFTVNPSGELVVMNAKYESTGSYSSLQDLVENVFPDITGKKGQEWIRQVTETATYNSWNYWRGALPEVDLDALVGKSSKKE